MVLINAAALSLLISPARQSIDHRLLARSKTIIIQATTPVTTLPTGAMNMDHVINDDVDADYHGNDHDSRYHGKTGRICQPSHSSLASADSDISPTPPPAAESNTSPCTKAVDLDLKLLGDSAVKACAL
ncbi:hypothetical protein K493DRAFT_322079 [Basidiobolus meristosporus CBS 931.73]|uniref:Uncharacterized protein n=1 Tax=Basidiobolus meristosporus CBS 931.73 TaxID=1314790 RepID=A0A1Y1VR33_9FUNG|nr:hypothetical protein K493DRAFT_322079 [Basidiobolus meristosporus CBS 931.73]|eukprot:ORX63748.1 hypothetical protein K493DRAFT_322079 [Basidiobolus meristosporus CBS 931.73]